MAKQAVQNTTQLTAGTMSYLGLNQQPFVDSILQLDAIYSDATRDQLVNTLKHHLQFSDLLLVVEGPQGSGKTTLFRQLIQEKTANLFVMPAIVSATDTLTQIQLIMSEQLKGQGSANYLDENLKNLHIFDQIPVLLIDDAHVLSDTTLQELIRYRSQLKLEHDTPLKILLLGNPGLAKTLETISDLQHNQMYVQQMPELTTKQVQSFIEHKLSKAKFLGDPIFDPETMQSIHKKSRGNPGNILRIAALLTEKYVTRQSRPKTSPVKLIGLALATFALAGVLYFGLQQFNSSPSAPKTAQVTTQQTLALENDSAAPVATEIAPVTAIETETPDIPVQTNTSTAQSESASIEETSLPPDVDQSVIESAPSEQLPTAHVQHPVADTVKTSSIKQSEPSAPPEPAIKPSKPATPVSAPAPATVPAPPAPEITTHPVQAPKIPHAENAYVSELASLGLHDAAWLQTQPASQWTIQVLASNNPKTLVKFARQNKLGDDSAWYETRVNDKPWFVLVHRFYTEAGIARSTLPLLPADLQRNQPWVKSLASIQKDIHK